MNIEREMREAAKRFECERAAQLRDRLKALRARALELSAETVTVGR